MRSFVAKRFETRPAGLSLDTEALARYADVIDLSIGDTDFTTDKRIIDAAYADALNGYTHYGDPKGDPELVDAVIQAWKEDFGQDIPREEVLVTTSSSIGMAQALLGIVNPGDEVIVLAPYFASYAQQIELAAWWWKCPPMRKTPTAPTSRSCAGSLRPVPGPLLSTHPAIPLARPTTGTRWKCWPA